jgi:hypothetical protein
MVLAYVAVVCYTPCTLVSNSIPIPIQIAFPILEPMPIPIPILVLILIPISIPMQNRSLQVKFKSPVMGACVPLYVLQLICTSSCLSETII